MQERFYSHYNLQQSDPSYPSPTIYIRPMDKFYDRYYEFEARQSGDVVFVRHDIKKFGPGQLVEPRFITNKQKLLIVNFVEFLDRLKKILGPDLDGKLWMFRNRYIGRYANSEYNRDDMQMEIKAIIVVLGLDNFLQDFF